MEIPRYVFQSPYPFATQVGRPDPQAQTQQNQESDIAALSQTDQQRSVSSSEYISQSSSASSLNVALSSVDSGVSSSLDSFSTLNSQIKAIEAFS